MPVVALRGVVKAFRIPSVRRETVREHVFGALARVFRSGGSPLPPSRDSLAARRSTKSEPERGRQSRRYETLTVLDGIDLEVRRGETVGVMGRNGCGKSTLLKVISGIYLPDRGEVAVRAPITPILELGVGWNPNLDAIDNIYLIGSVMGLSLREIAGAVDEILAFADLERFANLELRHYSSGMAARLAYSVAFRAVREVLVLDEIFAVGDAGFRARCQARYRELHAAGHTVILVSHEPHTIAAFCQRAILLEGGRVALEDRGERVADEYLRRLSAAPAAPVASTA